jgi:hypothetical protein
MLGAVVLRHLMVIADREALLRTSTPIFCFGPADLPCEQTYEEVLAGVFEAMAHPMWATYIDIVADRFDGSLDVCALRLQMPVEEVLSAVELQIIDDLWAPPVVRWPIGSA